MIYLILLVLLPSGMLITGLSVAMLGDYFRLRKQLRNECKAHRVDVATLQAAERKCWYFEAYFQRTERELAEKVAKAKKRRNRNGAG